jgi:carboxyl-terminal processing protease
MIHRKCSRLLLTFLCAVFVCLGFVGPARAADPMKDVGPVLKNELTPEQCQKNLESFDLVWQTVRDSHFDPKLGGVDWEGARTELRPRVEKANNTAEARAIMDDMLHRLGHTHVGIIPASLYESIQGNPDEEKPAKGSQLAVPGFDVRVVDGEALVVRVTEGLSAAKAGVRTGWRLRKIDGEDLAPLMASIRKDVKKAAEIPAVQAMAILWRLSGEEGKKVTVTYLDGSGEEVTLPLSLAKPKGNLVQFGQLPPMYVDFEARKVENDIAYFYLSSFLDPPRVMKKFGETVQANLKAEGFILDLRGNPGGIAMMSQGLGGWFVDQSNLKLGTQIGRKGYQHYILNPREDTYEGPLAILVDEFSASTSEILAGGLQGLKRARVFGTRTAGAALPSFIIRLPNGDGLQYVIADYVSVSGKRLEGNGVQPDEVVPLDRQALLAGRDPTLDAAVKWIRSQRGTVDEGTK